MLHLLILLPCRQQLGILTEVVYNNCFQVALDLELAEQPSATSLPNNRQASIKV